MLYKQKSQESRHIQINVWVITLAIEVCLDIFNYVVLFFYMFSSHYYYGFGDLLFTMIFSAINLLCNAYFASIMGSYSNFGDTPLGARNIPGVPENFGTA